MQHVEYFDLRFELLSPISSDTVTYPRNLCSEKIMISSENFVENYYLQANYKLYNV